MIPFVERIQVHQIGPMQAYMLPVDIRDVVSFAVSFESQPDFGAGEDLVQRIMVALLDKGTQQRDKFALADVLDGMGAQIRFSSDEDRISVTGRALREDLPEVVALMAEQLREPRLDPADFETAQARLSAVLHRAMEQTGTRAARALTRTLYPADHPNFIPDAQTELAQLANLQSETIQAYHQQHVGSNEMRAVFVGDIPTEALLTALHTHFADWPAHPASGVYSTGGLSTDAQTVSLPMPDKTNLDVRMGHPLPVRRTDPIYPALYIANYALGGNFSGRLMSRVRDELGLTYGVGSQLSDVSHAFDGHWQIGATLSPENLHRGLDEIRALVARFVAEGIRAEELADTQTAITGSFQVGLATTGGLAYALLSYAEFGFGPDYLDRFPKEIQAVTLEDVNQAITQYFHPERLQTCIAGTFPPAD